MRNHSLDLLFFLLISLCLAPAVNGQPMQAPPDASPGQISPKPIPLHGGLEGGFQGGFENSCADGVIKDDGVPETGWGWVPSVLWGVYVQEYESSEFSSKGVDEVCVCFLRTRPEDDDLRFDVVFYEDVEGQPAAEPYASVEATLDDIPLGIVGKFASVPVNVSIPEGTFYIGTRWYPSEDTFMFVCADTSPETPLTDMWYIDDRAEGEWTSVLDTTDPIFDPHRSIFVRPVPRDAFVVEVPTLPISGLVALAIALVLAAFFYRGQQRG